MRKKEYKNPFLEARSQRLETIKKIAIKLAPIKFFKLVGIVEIQYGLTRNKAMEHINALVRAGYLEKEKNIIKIVK